MMLFTLLLACNERRAGPVGQGHVVTMSDTGTLVGDADTDADSDTDSDADTDSDTDTDTGTLGSSGSTETGWNASTTWTDTACPFPCLTYSGPLFTAENDYADLDSWEEAGAPFSTGADYGWDGTTLTPVNGARAGILGTFVQAIIPDAYETCESMVKTTDPIDVSDLPDFTWVCWRTSDRRIALIRVEPHGVNPPGYGPGLLVFYCTWN